MRDYTHNVFTNIGEINHIIIRRATKNTNYRWIEKAIKKFKWSKLRREVAGTDAYWEPMYPWGNECYTDAQITSIDDHAYYIVENPIHGTCRELWNRPKMTVFYKNGNNFDIIKDTVEELEQIVRDLHTEEVGVRLRELEGTPEVKEFGITVEA